ncbi:hypothetical protein AA309_00925 [Microvirga vignae]|uniref:Uncharacterized protein n=1 Tax=Microvirga vignae TaxID=1225564 RepID=A0A0H1RQ72_9HYPH|nr:hypothetical protein [Microvirga vignae]KLK94802.1 hypothetical protein AA309_00925 [Microvirga vignae]
MSKAPRRVLSALSPNDQEVADQASNSDKKGMSATEAAQYIAEFTAELSYLARQTRLDLLAYLLDMARLEAARVLQAKQRKR